MARIPAVNWEGCALLRGGQPVQPDHLVHDALDMLQELRGGGTSKDLQFDASSVDASVAIIRVSATRMCKQQPTLPDREVFVDLAGHGLEYFVAGTTYTPLDDSVLSLPKDGAEPQRLASLLGPTGEDEVASFIGKSVLPTEVREQRLSAPDVPAAFLDPGVRKSRPRYLRLIHRLVRCGVLCFGTTRLCDVGLFAVSKKGGKQRLVVDARRANLCFVDPPGVSLPTAASFARLELRDGEELHASQFDLSNAFVTSSRCHGSCVRSFASLPSRPRRLGCALWTAVLLPRMWCSTRSSASWQWDGPTRWLGARQPSPGLHRVQLLLGYFAGGRSRCGDRHLEGHA